LIWSLLEEEIENTKSIQTLFRGNTLATKLFEMYIRDQASKYLIAALETSINGIVKDDKECEIDPSRFGKREDKEDLEDRHRRLECKFIFQSKF
jgi:hypothetical protein